MPQVQRESTAICWVTAAAISTLLCLVQLGVMLSLLLGRTGFRLVAPVGLLLALGLGVWLARKEGLSRQTQWLPSILVVVLVGISLALSAFYYDLSWDGQWYQQSGIIHIARDWNPLTDPMHPFLKHLQLWVRHYAKGPWYIAAAVFQTTGNIELGKCVQWLALAAAFLACASALLQQGIRGTAACALALLISLNPVVTSELTGFLVDSIMFSFLTVALAATITALRRPSPAVLLTAVAASIVAINAKFTGLVFLCIALAAIGIWILLTRRSQAWRFASIAACTLLLGACVWGYNPYVTNTIFRHQPFYPVLGSSQYPSLTTQGIDGIDRYETPKNIMGRSRLLRLGYATFGRPGNQPYFIGKDASLMWPFAAHPTDLYAYTFQETRVAGFGPWFSGSLLLALALAIWLLASRSYGRWAMLLALAAIAGSLLISPDLWWARYGPQMWWLPIVPLIFAFRKESPRPQRIAASALLGLLLVNAAIVATVRMHWETTHSIALRRQLKQLHDSGEEYRVSTRYFSESAQVRLDHAGVRYQDLGMKKIAHAQELTSVVEHYPDAIHYLPLDSPAH